MKKKLDELYATLYAKSAKSKKANLTELADILSQIARREKPWGYTFLRNLLAGQQPFTDDVCRAIEAAAAKCDGAHPWQAWGREETVIVLNGIERGAVVTGHSIRCPECLTLFVPDYGNRKYCHVCRPPRGRK